MRGVLAALVALAGVGALLWVAVSPAPPAGFEDPAELARVWDAAHVRIPSRFGVWRGSPEEAPVPDGLLLPLVIYLHGCAGLWPLDDAKLDLLAGQGYAAIAPDSLARRARPDSCDLQGQRGGLDRPALFLRQAEARYTLDRARRLAWADPRALFLFGFSEGGTAVATVDIGSPIAGRIIEAWTCHSPWLDYRGLNGPSDEPVLALLGGLDPWFRAWWLRGDCGAFFRAAESRSVVFEQDPLAESHSLLWHADAQAELAGFLERVAPRRRDG